MSSSTLAALGCTFGQADGELPVTAELEQVS